MKLGEVCENVSKVRNSELENVILIQSKDLLAGTVTNHTYVPNKNLMGHFKKLFQRGDILYSRARPENRRFAFVDFDASHYVASEAIMVIRANERVLPEFLFMVLRSDKIVNRLQWLAKLEAGLIPAFTFSELAALDVRMPSLSDQEKIASTLRLFDIKISNNLKMNHNLMQTAQDVFKSWFVDFEPWDGTPPSEWSEKSISDICIKVTDGTHNAVKDDPDGAFFLLSCKNVKNGSVVISNNERRINEAAFQKLRNNTQLAKGDILFCSVGRFGEMALILEDPASFEFQCGVAAIKPNPKYVSPVYLYMAMLRHKKKMLRLANGTAQQHIALRDIRKFSILLPDFDAMTKFSEIVEPLLSRISNNHMGNKTLAATRDTILPQLLSGELSVEDISFD
jgi:type I restriction enzyme S subunit